MGAYSLRSSLPAGASNITQPTSSPYLLAANQSNASAATGGAGTKLSPAELLRLQKLLVALVQARDGASGGGGGTSDQLRALAALAGGSSATGATSATGKDVSISGGTTSDRKRLDAAIDQLASMRTGKAIAGELRSQGANFVIDDDKIFEAAGHGTMKAYYNESDNTIHVRASVVRDKVPITLLHDIAHEGTHFMDAHSDRKQAYLQRRSATIAQLGGAGSPAAEKAAGQLLLEDSLITETNAHFNGALVLRELGVKPEEMSGSVAPTALKLVGSGGSTNEMLRGIWAGLLKSQHYNPNGVQLAYQTYDKV